ncbi:MAG: 1-acyl-sn-glycerol-3-phosphate acyltransferase [Chloroflexota bacterium]
MSELSAKVRGLRRAITDEVIKALGMSPSGWTRAALGPLLFAPAQRFSLIAAEFDRRVAEVGLVEAARWALGQFRTRVEVSFQGPVPEQGPLLITANHPGTVDGLAIAASVGRQDLKIVASGLPFIRGLPRTARHLIYATVDPHDRMGTVRAMIRHLRQGGAVLIFPSGKVDPDPAVLPGAEEALRTWSPSTGLVLRTLPETRVLMGVVSGVLSGANLRNPIARLRKELRERQLVAEMLQVIRQMLFEGSEMLTARLTLSAPIAGEQLAKPGQGARELTQALIQKAQGLLREHLAAVGGPPQRAGIG